MRDAIEALLRDYVRALDERHLEDWADCFASEAAYTVIPRSNVERGLPLCVMADETKARIQDRILFIQKIWTGNFTDYVPRHLHSLMTIAAPDTQGAVRVLSNFAAYATEPEGNTILLAVGEYRDVVVKEGGRWRFRTRQVVLDTDILPRYLVYPI